MDFKTSYNNMCSSDIILTLSLPVTRMCVNFSTVYNDMLVAKGLNHSSSQDSYN